VTFPLFYDIRKFLRNSYIKEKEIGRKIEKSMEMVDKENERE
jgi:hypothetical protein